MSVDTFPELTPPVLVVGTLAPGPRPEGRGEDASRWRLEKYVSATPGVDHVESVSRNNLSIIYVWLKWGTDLNSAQTLVQQQAAFAMAAVPKSLGVLPPFVLQYDPSNAPVVQVVVGGAGYTGPQLYDYAFNNIEPLARGHPRRRQRGARRRAAAADQHRRRPGQGAGARRHVRRHRRGGGASPTRSCPPASSSPPKFDANVYTNAIPERRRAPSATRRSRWTTASPCSSATSPASRTAARPPTQSVSVNGEDAVYLNVLRIPGGNTHRDRRRGEEAWSQGLKDLPPGLQVKAVLRPVDLRAHHLPRPQEGDHPGARPHRARHPRSSCRASAAR